MYLFSNILVIARYSDFGILESIRDACVVTENELWMNISTRALIIGLLSHVINIFIYSNETKILGTRGS